MINRYLIYSVLFIAFFFGLFVSAGMPRYLQLLSEVFIIIFLFFAFLSNKNKGFPIPDLFFMVIVFAIITLFSIAINHATLSRAIFSLRLLFRFLLFYWGITLCDFEENTLKKMNYTVLLFLIAQLPIVAYKFSQYGILETTMGGYAVHDGSVAAMLPIVVIFFMASFYFFYKPKKIYIFLGIGFILFSIVAKKRAVFFLYPFQFFAIFYFIYVKGTSAPITKKMLAFVTSIFAIVIVGMSILYFNDTLNRQKEIGKIDLEYALEYAAKYNRGVDGYGRTFGRLATAQRTMQILAEKGLAQLLFGIGPGSTTGSALDSAEGKAQFAKKFSELEITYGMTTMTKIALEYGVAGVIAFSSMLLILVRTCLRWYKLEFEPYWKAFAAGSIAFGFSMLFFAFGYHFTAFWGNIMPALYFYSMAVAHTRYGQIEKPSNKSIPITGPAAQVTHSQV